MSKKRGLSLEEKRGRLLEVFHENGEVFVLKEVEKLGVKKGITPQSIKDVLQSLVDDDLVHQEKIGSANYFWSFPSEASMAIERDTERVRRQLESGGAKKAELEALIEEEKEKRQESVGLADRKRTMDELREEVRRLETEVQSHADHDPEMLEKIHEGTIHARDAANRWLDNIFALQSWCRKRFQGMETEVQKLFEANGIDDDVDYIE